MIIDQLVARLASPAALIVWGLLGAYGAIEAFLRLLRGIPKLYYWCLYKWRNRHIAKDFYYTSREASYRIYPDGKTFLYPRKETVVALKDNFSEVPFSFRWTGEGTVEASISSGFTMVDAPRIRGQARERKLIHLDNAINKGEECSYTVTVKCGCDRKQPEPFLGTSASHRIDQLAMRLVFPLENLPRRVSSTIQDRDGHELDRRAVEDVDLITGEYRIDVKRPDAHTIYQMEWEY